MRPLVAIAISYEEQMRRVNAQASKTNVHLNLRAADPSYSRKLVLHQQMIRLVVESPLANNEVRARVLHALDHIRELRLFVLPQLLVLLHARDV